MSKLICTIAGVPIYQDEDKRVHYIADLDCDVDGSPFSYRLDNKQPPALDDIHASAGWPEGSWWNVLVRDPNDRNRPYVDEMGYCISMTSYQDRKLTIYDRHRYVDASTVPYAVPPGAVRRLCRGVLLGCAARITDTVTGKQINCVTADFSGGTIGEASLAAAVFFNPKLSAHNGDGRNRYMYEYWPGKPANVLGKVYELQAA